MTTLRRHLGLETLFLISMAVAVGLFFVVYRNNNYRLNFNIASDLPSVQAPTEVIAPKITISSQISPDGEKLVIMKVTENTDNTSVYEFSTANEDGANEKLVFVKTLDSSRSMSIPFNTWSPDDKYFFIQENAGGSKNIFVFKATGEPFSDLELFFDGNAIFAGADTGNDFDEATGWASETLIIINTTNQDGKKGHSYWLEIPSKAIIQLATDF